MRENGKTMVLSSFVGDSLGLGVHWIYDTARIEKGFGRVDTFLKPASDSYHPTKERGEFTHYGDQTFVLLESLAAKRGFQLDDFAARWRRLFEGYDGYYDQATKATLQNFSLDKRPQDAGSPSNELSGASRVAPIVFCYRDDLDTLVEAARDQTRMTHNDRHVIDGAEFFGRVSWLVLRGTSPIAALEEVSNERFDNSPLWRWVRDGIESKAAESVSTIARFGQSCHVDDAFAGVVHLIAKYEDNLEQALVQAVMAGGDSAGRAMIVGMVLGAHLGEQGLPEQWVSGLRKRREIMDLLDKIP
ncbi:MAG: ADP-ribosylglycohydrolase family protein [Deltaproteobacteria bacterium]|nr:MAG: ADP-ribosylglycohydrolase family protein [Deltaproteobacteria bacterium]